MGRNLEANIQGVIRHQNWDLDYYHGRVTNIWGTEFTVNLQPSGSCLQLPGVTYPADKRIILREPCGDRIETTLNNSKEENMAYILAHEVGHADTWGISVALPYLVLSVGVLQAIKKKSWTPMKTAALGLAGCKIVVDELLAETAATIFHDVPFMHGMYLSLPNLEGFVRQLGNY